MSVQTMNRNINDMTPAAKQACQLFFQECYKAGIHVFVVETYRSQARQNWLYAQGRTRPGNVVTWTLNSRHKSRLAWDIAAATVAGNSNIYNTAIMKRAGQIARRLGITWGGTWSTPDYPHFEVTNSWRIPAGYSLDKSVFVPTRSNQMVKLSGSSSTPAPTPPSSGGGGIGLVEYLNQQGIDSSMNNRRQLALKFGIIGYAGTAAQNTKLLSLVRADIEKPKEEKEEVDTMKQLNATLRAFIVGELKKALDDGTISSKDWLEKAKKNELSASEISGLHMYIDRSKRMSSNTSPTMKNSMEEYIKKAMDAGLLHDEKWLEDFKSGKLSIADAVLLVQYLDRRFEE